MPIVLKSVGGGGVTLDVPSTASNISLTLPATGGSIVTTQDIGTITPDMITQKRTFATAQNTTSGTAFNFTSIPSWVRVINIMFDGVSTSGTAALLVQIGASTGIETTGYVSGSAINRNGLSGAAATFTSGFAIYSLAAPYTSTGIMTLVNMGSNKWVSSHSLSDTAAGSGLNGGGVKSLSAALDRIRLTTANGTDTFDAGAVNIMYEG